MGLNSAASVPRKASHESMDVSDLVLGAEEPGHIAKYHCLMATSPRGFLTGADTSSTWVVPTTR